MQDDPDPRLARTVGVADVGPPVLAAHVPGEAVVVVGGDLDVTPELQGPVGAGRVEDQQGGPGSDHEVPGLYRVVFSRS